MDFVFLSNATMQVFYFFVWSTALVLIVTGCIRLTPNLQYWSTLWKATLLLCLLPLVPWPQLELSASEFPIAYQYLPELPELWVGGEESLHSAMNDTELSAVHTAMLHLAGLTTLSVMIVSLLKALSFFYTLFRFNRSIANYEVLDSNSTTLAFLTKQQRAFLKSHHISIRKSGDLVSPFATGLVRPSIVLPASFFILPEAQQRLLIEHEMTHIKRRDLVWLMLSQLCKSLFWFAPAIHLIKSKMDLSIEVECDRHVLGNFPDMTKEYGSALINVIRHTQHSINPQAVFFINQQFSDLKSRIKFIQKPTLEHGKSYMNKMTLIALAIFFSATSWALNTNVQDIMTVEDFIKLHKHSTRFIEDHKESFDSSATWVNPVKTSSVSSGFKARQKIRGYQPHLGIDLKAKIGDPIVAASDGVVIIADSDSLHQNHGNVVVIDHGQGTLSMYSHMDQFNVKKGDLVKAGQLLGKVGNTGQATGPHLHFEIIAENRHINPATLIEFND
ncbi:hypothetical protein EYS14_21795 [Alteromonadaceae bacterium M269]|nr:hypothetical protein EYS14_21795 [Alteromonadaceae bacterium M269]